MKSIRLIRPYNMLSIAVLLIIFKIFLENTSFLKINGILDAFLSGLFSIITVMYILKQKYSIKTLLMYLLIALAALYVCYNMKSTQILITVLMCLSIRKENLNKVIRFVYQTEVVFFLITVLLSVVFRIVDGNSLYAIIDGVVRYKFGFVHPNVLSAVCFNIIIMYLWLNYETLNRKKILTILAIEIVLYFFTKTRTSLIAMLFIVLLICFYRNKKESKVIQIASMSSVPLLSIGIYIASTLYRKGNFIVMAIDALLTGRIRLAAYANNTIGITFWGTDALSQLQGVTWDSVYGLNSFTFDCLYSEFWFYIGVVVLLFVSLLFFMLGKKGNVKIGVFIIAWAMYSITEVHGINCFLCFPIMIVSLLFKETYLKTFKSSILYTEDEVR